MDFSEIERLDHTYVAQTYARYSVAFAGGKGATLLGTDGKDYLDFGAGIAVNTFGANDEGWKRAVIEQLNRVQHVSNYYYSEPVSRLAALLCKRTGAKRVFFSNSGAEANECAFKAARKFALQRYGEGREKIVTLEGSFHGRTLFTLTATGQERFHRYFGPFVPAVESVPADIGAVEKALGGACAVCIECVQGESGVNPLPFPFVKELAALCREKGVLLLCDEVQTGNGRTGKLFCYEHYGISPDIVTTAKGLAGGLPIGATLLFGETEHAFSAGDHGSTFGGNPVSCAAAVNVVERLDAAFLASVTEKGNYLQERLASLQGVKQVTGMGLMLGLVTEKPAGDVARACLGRGLLVLTAGEKVRLLPPLVITKEEMDGGVKILKEVLK